MMYWILRAYGLQAYVFNFPSPIHSNSFLEIVLQVFYGDVHQYTSRIAYWIKQTGKCRKLRKAGRTVNVYDDESLHSDTRSFLQFATHQLHTFVDLRVVQLKEFL